jgi:hypothetical protein
MTYTPSTRSGLGRRRVVNGRASNLLAGFLGGLVGTLGLGALLAIYAPQSAWTQAALLHVGGWTPGHAPIYGTSTGQPTVLDSGPAVGGGPGIGLSELLLVSRAAPGQGTGPLGTQKCQYDASTSTGSFHYLCSTANDGAGHGLIVFGAGGLGTPFPLAFNINGTLVVPVACSGTPTASFAVVNGFVTHC